MHDTVTQMRLNHEAADRKLTELIADPSIQNAVVQWQQWVIQQHKAEYEERISRLWFRKRRGYKARLARLRRNYLPQVYAPTERIVIRLPVEDVFRREINRRLIFGGI